MHDIKYIDDLNFFEPAKVVDQVLKTTEGSEESSCILLVADDPEIALILKEAIKKLYSGHRDVAFKEMLTLQERCQNTLVKYDVSSVADMVNDCFVDLEWTLEDYHENDQLLTLHQSLPLSSLILSYMIYGILQKHLKSFHWCDARDIIKCNDNFANPQLDLPRSIRLAKDKFDRLPGSIVTQCTIGSTSDNLSVWLEKPLDWAMVLS